MYTRQQGNSQLVSTENPEDLVRKARRNSMATPVRQTDPRDNQQRNNSDSEDENDPPRNIPLLYVPDLANTVLSEANKGRHASRQLWYRIHHPYTTVERHSGYRTTQGVIT